MREHAVMSPQFHANAPGTYKPKVTFFADNAATAAKKTTLTVSP